MTDKADKAQLQIKQLLSSTGCVGNVSLLNLKCKLAAKWCKPGAIDYTISKQRNLGKPLHPGISGKTKTKANL